MARRSRPLRQLFPRIIGALAAGALGLACEGRGVDPGRAETIPIDETLRIGSADGAGPATFAQIRALVVDPGGRIYVLDGQEREVRVFAADGRHVRTFGRQGSGPGELREPIGLAWGPEGKLWVVDPGNGRYAVFDTAGARVAEHRRLLSGWVVPWAGGTDDAGRFWDSFNARRPGAPEVLSFVRLDPDLRPADTLVAGPIETEYFEMRVGGGSERAHVPFTPWLAARRDPRGGVWIRDAAAYRLHRVTLDGDTVGSIERPYDPVPVSGEERDSAVARLAWYRDLGGAIDPGRIPREKPAFDAFFTDRAGGLWVPLRTAGDEVPGEATGRVWDRFDPQGRYVGRYATAFETELYVPRPVFTADAVYAVTRDGLGVQYVVVGAIPRR